MLWGDDGNAIIDAADPKCGRCGIGDETPLHLLTDCQPLANLRMHIFGTHNLVNPGEIPDFSDLPVYKIIAFFREAKFETLQMLPFAAQYLPTNTASEESNQSLRAQKEAANKEGSKWTSKYLFHIPMVKGRPSKKTNDSLDTPPSTIQQDSGNNWPLKP